MSVKVSSSETPALLDEVDEINEKELPFLFVKTVIFLKKTFLSASLNRTRASRNHFFLSPDFHDLWHSHNDFLSFTEVKRQWVTLVLGWVAATVHYSCLRWLCTCGRGPKPYLLALLKIKINYCWDTCESNIENPCLIHRFELCT